MGTNLETSIAVLRSSNKSDDQVYLRVLVTCNSTKSTSRILFRNPDISLKNNHQTAQAAQWRAQTNSDPKVQLSTQTRAQSDNGPTANDHPFICDQRAILQIHGRHDGAMRM